MVGRVGYILGFATHSCSRH